MGIRAAETFFELLQLHLQPPDLLEQLSFLGLPLLLVLGVLAPAEQLAGSVQQLPFPLAQLDRVDGVVSGDLLGRLAATERLHGYSGRRGPAWAQAEVQRPIGSQMSLCGGVCFPGESG